MPPKVGRNSPCPCGSGKKYKVCHLRIEEAAARAASELSDPAMPGGIGAQLRARQEAFDQLEDAGYLMPHIECEIPGWRVRGIGAQVQLRPPAETFHEFLIYHLMWNLGEKWFSAQRALPPPQRHFLMKCWDHYHEWQVRHQTEANRDRGGWRAIPDGWTRFLIAVAFDVYSLRHRGELPRALMQRLKHPDQFQGARYELGIAALFVRVGCEIEFLDGKTPAGVVRHCEFLARHLRTGVEIGVEAKSRHRDGILGRPGEAQSHSAISARIGGLFSEALEQAPGDRPFMVFVDVNAPMDVRVPGVVRPWVAGVESFTRQLSAGTPEVPVPWNVVAITNFSYHYSEDQQARRGQFAVKAATHPKFPLSDVKFHEYLRAGLENYGEVPDLP